MLFYQHFWLDLHFLISTSLRLTTRLPCVRNSALTMCVVKNWFKLYENICTIQEWLLKQSVNEAPRLELGDVWFKRSCFSSNSHSVPCLQMKYYRVTKHICSRATASVNACEFTKGYVIAQNTFYSTLGIQQTFKAFKRECDNRHIGSMCTCVCTH